MGKHRKYPPMPFDTGDWLRCPELRSVAPDVRALWMDMLCYMWESSETGVMVAPNGTPYGQADIIRIVGLDNNNSTAWLQTLIDSGVCGVRSDGAIYCRRMVRDADLRAKRAEAGRKGGQTARGRDRDRKAEIEASRPQNEPIAPPAENPAEDEAPPLQLFPTEPEIPKAKPVKKKKEEEPKIQFAEFVRMTQREYDKLVIDHGKVAVDWMIDKLDNSKGSSGRKYVSDYRAILNWVVDAYYKENGYGKQQYNRNSGSNTPTPGGFATGSTISDD